MHCVEATRQPAVSAAISLLDSFSSLPRPRHCSPLSLIRGAERNLECLWDRRVVTGLADNLLLHYVVPCLLRLRRGGKEKDHPLWSLGMVTAKPKPESLSEHWTWPPLPPDSVNIMTRATPRRRLSSVTCSPLHVAHTCTSFRYHLKHAVKPAVIDAGVPITGGVTRY